MASINDVAAAIIDRVGPMTAMKLQKLVYYSQAWNLVWEENLLFDSPIEAWANGPVAPELYKQHRGSFDVQSWRGDPTALTDSERTTVESVIKFYGDKTGPWLSDLTHREPPWVEARDGLAPGDRGNSEISPAAMAEYYGSL